MQPIKADLLPSARAQVTMVAQLMRRVSRGRARARGLQVLHRGAVPGAQAAAAQPVQGSVPRPHCPAGGRVKRYRVDAGKLA